MVALSHQHTFVIYLCACLPPLYISLPTSSSSSLSSHPPHVLLFISPPPACPLSPSSVRSHFIPLFSVLHLLSLPLTSSLTLLSLMCPLSSSLALTYALPLSSVLSLLPLPFSLSPDLCVLSPPLASLLFLQSPLSSSSPVQSLLYPPLTFLAGWLRGI